jgi:putative RecB family exonuclease
MTCYSHSRLSTFEQCKYKYKLNYIDKVKVDIPTTVEAFMGSKVHETLEKLYNDLKFQKLNSLDELLSFYKDIWKKEWTDDILIAKSAYKEENYRKMGEKFISDYYLHYKPFDQMTILGLETQDRMPLSNGDHYHVRIDKLGCIGNTYYVCDYKTNSRMKDQEEADADRQLAMYSIWVRDKFKDAKKVVLLWHMLAFDKEVTSERSEKELKRLHEETIKLIKEEIESCKEFGPEVTALCSWCQFKGICPAFKHEVELEEKTVEEFKEDEGVQIVDEYAHLQAEMKELGGKMEDVKKDLIRFAAQHDYHTVFGSNMKASVKPYIKIVYPEDKEKLVELLKKKGIYEQVAMVSYPKLTSMIKKEEIDKSIIKLTSKEQDYRVRLSSKKNESD